MAANQIVGARRSWLALCETCAPPNRERCTHDHAEQERACEKCGGHFVGGCTRAHPPAPALLPCPKCGGTLWTSITLTDGTPKGKARCKGCGHERATVPDPYQEHAATLKPEEVKQFTEWETPDGIEAELRWYYVQSEGDLGAHSSWESKVQQANFGQSVSPAIELIGGEPTAQTPSEQRIWAASRCNRVRTALSKLTRDDQAILEASFSLRRQHPQIRMLVGRELEPTVSWLIVCGRVALADVTDEKRRPKVIARAAKALNDALAAYRIARSPIDSGVPQQTSARPKKGGIRRQAGSRGAARRKLVPEEAPRGTGGTPEQA